MAKLQIPLNGSNIVNKDRQQAFKESLEDDHRIDCAENAQIKVASQDTPRRDAPSAPVPRGSSPQSGIQRQVSSQSSLAEFSLSQALEHTYKHQERTMEIHQQYLAQQTEYIQLITSVLDQQGKVLDHGTGNGTSQMVETFQRTLDNFHVIREQGIRVHQEFLQQQAAFSERYLLALDGSQLPRVQGKVASPAESQQKQVTEWVVHQPPIIVDDYTPVESQPAQETAPAGASAMKIKTDPTPATAVDSSELAEALLEIVADKTGYPADMLELDMDLEADLGIDSIKRVEILGSLEEKYPALPAANTEILGQTRTLKEILEYLDAEAPPLSSETGSGPETGMVEEADLQASTPTTGESEPKAAVSSEHLQQTLLEIVADKTGYPADMLEMDMDMEADLGIDSIKRVEILGTMEEQVPGLPRVEAETLANLRTLGQIIDLMGSAESPGAVRLPVEGEDKKKAESLSLERTPVILETLPEPDRLVFRPDQDRPLILSDDGTDFTSDTAAALTAQGWKVVVWSFPDRIPSGREGNLPAEIPVIHQSGGGKEGIEKALNEIRTTHGVPAGFIHLHPPRPASGELFAADESDLIKQVFLITGAIKADLDLAQSNGRNLLLVVLRGDGTLGLSGEHTFQEGSGLAGLVKTLRWEWQDVFCRYLDISHQLDNDTAVRILLDEMQDPDRSLAEIGASPAGRQTPRREYPDSL